MKRATLFLICCLCFSKQYCQPCQYNFSHINFNHGLSNNHITCCFKDSRGFIWFGTQCGLNRYDGYKIKQFKHSQQDSNSIADNYIYQVFEGPEKSLWVETAEGRFSIYDAASEKFYHNYSAWLVKWSLPDSWVSTVVKGKNGYWFVYPDIGLYRYTPGGKVIAVKHIENDNNTISADKIADVKEDTQGNVWVIHRNGVLEKVDGIQNKVVFRTDIFQKNLPNLAVDYNMFVDGQDDLWVHSGSFFKGVFYYHPPTNELKHLCQDSKGARLTSNYIYNIIQDEKGLVWLATDHGGVNVVNKKDFSVKCIVHSEEDAKSLPENTVSVLYKDNLNIIWLGTSRSGLSYYHDRIIKFPHYRHQPANPKSLSYDDINSFATDAAGNIWIGSNGGGLIYFNRRDNTFSQYLHDANNAASLSNNVIVTLLIDKTNKLWIGTYFGGLDCFDGKTFTHHRHSDSLPGSIADDRVMSLYADENNDLWVGTLGQGIDLFDREKKTFAHHKSGGANSIINNYISSIVGDAENKLWIGTAYGIDVLEKSTGKIIHYSSENNKLSNNNVTCLYKDSSGRMWVGTREGLNLFDPAKKIFHSFGVADGLTDNTIRSIVADNKQELWLGTLNGISNIKLLAGNQRGLKITCKKYDEQDGLQGREFNEKASLLLANGELVFGGPNGFNIFKPANVVRSSATPSIVFTDLQVFNERVPVGIQTGGRVILSKAISESGEITLNYNENVFSVEFASLGFINTAKYKYAYTLKGFNKTWLTTDGNIRKATYTNLDPGEYTLRVKAATEDGVWGEKEADLKIIILPPFWRTTFAYIIYLLITGIVLYLARRLVIKRAKVRFELENERMEARRTHALDMVKIRFFTNMNHELRTPLSLILAPVEKLLHSPQLPDPQKQYELIRRNAKRLLNLVNQLLDFRKLEVNELKLHPEQGDILKFLKDAAFSFTDLAEKKNISFCYKSTRESMLTCFDHDKIERILFNLLSNAFKFTPENGAVSVEVNTQSTETDEALAEVVEVKVRDNGIGIAAGNQPRIFERFFQIEVPDNILNQGSGIGLAITREFVKMHQGDITVESRINEGACFTVTLPFKAIKCPQQLATADDVPGNIVPFTAELGVDEEKETPPAIYGCGGKRGTILVVEDNHDFRFYLKDNISAYYNIIEACNGKEGWQKALALHPDLVVTDISMPLMDGITLCRKIKSDERTRQIPVILLTALSGESQELKGLETGASDYLVKPFNFEILLSKLRNLLEYSETIKRTYQKQVQVNQADIEITSADGKFIQSVLDLIEKNMSNADFSVEELSRELFFSRATIYKKLLALTGKTPIEFIRHVRLKRAAVLLEKSQMTVAEIAYTVGFNNPKYFARYFKAEFNLVPSAFAAEKKLKWEEGLSAPFKNTGNAIK